MNEAILKIGRLIRDPSIEVDMTGFIFALLVSCIVALAVSALYQIFYENRATGSQIHRSFLLMGPSITALFIAIQFSLPLSLGLLGALSIIRFRTPIKEPEEVGFIMLLIATSVVCATFQFLLLLVLLGLALGFLMLQKYVPGLVGSKRNDGILLLVIDGSLAGPAREKALAILNKRLTRGKLQGISYASDFTTIHYTFTNLDGQGVEGLEAQLREAVPIHRLNVFFNNQGALA
jgi:Domain of unknown function (DUF4956)